MVRFSKTHRLFIMTLLGTIALSSPCPADDIARANIVISPAGGGGTAASPGQGQAGATYRVTAHVPMACWVRPETRVLVEEGASGAAVEACNNPGGFTVTAAYRPLGTSETAQMIYDDRTLDLAKSGTQVLRRSSMATIKRVAYRFQSVTLDAPLILSLTIQPI